MRRGQGCLSRGYNPRQVDLCGLTFLQRAEVENRVVTRGFKDEVVLHVDFVIVRSHWCIQLQRVPREVRALGCGKGQRNVMRVRDHERARGVRRRVKLN